MPRVWPIMSCGGGRAQSHRSMLCVKTLVYLTGIISCACVMDREWKTRGGEKVEERKLSTKVEEGQSASGSDNQLFTTSWETDFANGLDGCQYGRGTYEWRRAGFGSNINNLLNAWVRALAVENWTDMAVVIGPSQMKQIECRKESRGRASVGWECLFSPMPHLCTFNSTQSWKHAMASKGVSKDEQEKAAKLDLHAVRSNPSHIARPLEALDVDHFTALAVMARHVWRYVTPWLKWDVKAVLDSPQFEEFKKWPFLGLHVRRGDKVVINGQGIYHSCEEYLSVAVRYLENSPGPVSVEEIRGIWIASDDPNVLDEVRVAAPGYFPNVSNGTVVWASGGVNNGLDGGVTSTHTQDQTYAQVVDLFADLQQLTNAPVFVCTFSSNIGKFVALLRKAFTKHSDDSVINISKQAWTPGRRQI